MRYVKAFLLGTLVSLCTQEALAFGLAALMQRGAALVVASAAILVLAAPVFARLADDPAADRGWLCQAMVGALAPTLKGPCMVVPMLTGEIGLTFANLALWSLFLVAMTVTLCVVLHIVFTTQELNDHAAWLRTRLKWHAERG